MPSTPASAVKPSVSSGAVKRKAIETKFAGLKQTKLAFGSPAVREDALSREEREELEARITRNVVDKLISNQRTSSVGGRGLSVGGQLQEKEKRRRRRYELWRKVDIVKTYDETDKKNDAWHKIRNVQGYSKVTHTMIRNIVMEASISHSS